MIPEIIRLFDENREAIKAKLAESPPTNYKNLVELVVSFVTSDIDWDDAGLDPKRVVEIDHGEYQGTLVYVIGGKGYQPNHYWFVKVSYGSCSGCDTLQAIQDYQSGEEAANEYFKLALHIAQGITAMQPTR